MSLAEVAMRALIAHAVVEVGFGTRGTPVAAAGRLGVLPGAWRLSEGAAVADLEFRFDQEVTFDEGQLFVDGQLVERMSIGRTTWPAGLPYVYRVTLVGLDG